MVPVVLASLGRSLFVSVASRRTGQMGLLPNGVRLLVDAEEIWLGFRPILARRPNRRRTHCSEISIQHSPVPKTLLMSALSLSPNRLLKKELATGLPR